MYNVYYVYMLDKLKIRINQSSLTSIPTYVRWYIIQSEILNAFAFTHLQFL